LIKCLINKYLPPELELDIDLRDALETRLKSLELEDRITELKKLTDDDIYSDRFFKLVWPDFSYFQCGVTGSFSQYMDILKEQTGVEKAHSITYSASEFYGGSNYFEDDNFFYPHRETYFEFIPLEEMKEEVPNTINQFSHLEDGNIYELVISSLLSGFCRYRTGDLIKIHFVKGEGGEAKAPKFEIIGRDFAPYNIADEMIQEFHIKEVISILLQKCSELFSLGFFYRSLQSLSYEFYLELKVGREEFSESDFDFHQEVEVIDKLLRKRNRIYDGQRESGGIHIPKLLVVRQNALYDVQFKRRGISGVKMNQIKSSMILNDSDACDLKLVAISSVSGGLKR
jgi:hypothetical protein